MNDEPDQALLERALNLLRNPDHHDPEALRFLLGAMASKIADQAQDLNRYRQAIGLACHQLDKHASGCSVSAEALECLRASGLAPIATQEVPIPEGFKGICVSRRTIDGKFWIRAHELPANTLVVEPLGPFETDAEADTAVFAALEKQGISPSSHVWGTPEEYAEMAMHKAGIDPESLVSGLVAAAMNPQQSRRVH